MSVLPTPVVTAQNFQAGLYRGLGLAQLAILRNEMAKGKLKISQRRLKLASGLEIVCKITYNIEEVFITLPPSMPPEEVKKIKEIFAFHPRSGPIALLPYFDNENLQYIVGVDGGGYAGTKDLPDVYSYPLVDGDHGTFAVIEEEIPDKIIWTIHWTNEENYGNLFWIGENEDQIVSWRGIPNRHFALSSRIYLPGLSQIEETVGLLDYYSCFGNRVYYQGQVLCELEHTIAGAWFYGGFLVCAAVINKRNTTGGFFFQLMAYRNGVWENIGIATRLSHRCTFPAFPDKTGRKFVFENTCFTLAVDSADVNHPVLSIESTETFEPTTAGTRTIIGTGGWNSTYQYQNARRNDWGESVNEQFIYSAIVHNATFATIEHGNKGEKSYEVPVYRANGATSLYLYPLDPGLNPCPVSCKHDVLVLGAFANGAYCDITWTGVSCYSGGQARICIDQCNTDISVTATLHPQNISATFTRMHTDFDIIVTGPDNVTVGSTYGASNTIGDVIWSFDSGEMSHGNIVSVDSCGMGTITVTDACGRTGSKQVRLPDGVWQMCADINSIVGPYSGYYYTYYNSGVYTYRLVKTFYNYCGNFANCDAAWDYANNVWKSLYSEWQGIEYVHCEPEYCLEGSTPMWVGLYWDFPYSWMCQNEECP